MTILQTDWPFMVVPYPEKDEKACKKKEKFNKKLRRGRTATIECGFGVWKNKYPVLHNGISAKNPKEAGKLIVVLGKKLVLLVTLRLSDSKS